MRILLLKFLYPILALASFINPIYGLNNYAFVTIIRPESLMWGGNSISNISLMAIVCLLFSALFRGKIKLSIFNYPFFISLALFCGFFCLSTYISLFSDSDSFQYLKQILVIFIYCCSIYWLLDDENKIEKYLNNLFLFFLFMAVWGVQQRMLGNTLIEGLFGHYITDRCTITGVYVLVFPVALYKFLHPRHDAKYKKIIGLVGSVFFLLIIVFTESRAGFLGLVISMVVLSFSVPQKFKKTVIALVVFFCLLPFLPAEYLDRMVTITQGVHATNPNEMEDYSSASRVVLWSVAFDIFKEYPLLGVGNLNFTHAASLFRNNYVNALDPRLYAYIFDGGLFAHNMFFNILAEGGVLVSVPFYLVLLLPLVRSYKAIKLAKTRNDMQRQVNLVIYLRAGYIGWLVTAFFSNAMYVEYAYWIMTLLVILTCQIEKRFSEGCCVENGR